MAGLTPAHAADLRRLSTCTATTPSTSAASNGLFSFSQLAEAVISHLKASAIPVHPGLSDAEFAHLEACSALPSPPTSVLSLPSTSLLPSDSPTGAPFPDSAPPSTSPSPPSPFRSPVPSSGPVPRVPTPPTPTVPSDSPVLPSAVLGSSFPSSTAATSPTVPPCLVGNPVFFIDESRLVCCGFDLSSFFRQESTFCSPSPSLRLHPFASNESPSSTRRSLDSITGKTPLLNRVLEQRGHLRPSPP